MTTEELLKPRFRPIFTEGGHYPDSPFKEEQVIELVFSNMNDAFYFKQGVLTSKTWWEDDFKKFSNLFRPVKWWQERNIEDLPEYVKDIRDGDIYKVIEFHLPQNYISVQDNSRVDKLIASTYQISDFFPSTLQEYNTYMSKPKKI